MDPRGLIEAGGQIGARHDLINTKQARFLGPREPLDKRTLDRGSRNGLLPAGPEGIDEGETRPARPLGPEIRVQPVSVAPAGQGCITNQQNGIQPGQFLRPASEIVPHRSRITGNKLRLRTPDLPEQEPGQQGRGHRAGIQANPLHRGETLTVVEAYTAHPPIARDTDPGNHTVIRARDGSHHRYQGNIELGSLEHLGKPTGNMVTHAHSILRFTQSPEKGKRVQVIDAAEPEKTIS